MSVDKLKQHECDVRFRNLYIFFLVTADENLTPYDLGEICVEYIFYFVFVFGFDEYLQVIFMCNSFRTNWLKVD